MASDQSCFPISDEIPPAPESSPRPHQSSLTSLTRPDAGKGDLCRRSIAHSQRTGEEEEEEDGSVCRFRKQQTGSN